MTVEPTSAQSGRLSQTALRLRPNAIRAMAPLLSRPGLVSFAGGVPSAATFPVDAIARIASKLIRDDGPRVLQYGTTRGNRDLAALVVDRLRARGVAWAAPENLMLTSGSQQGLDLLARVLVDPGDIVFCELPSYIGGLSSLWAAGAELVGVRLTERGPDVEELERKVAEARTAGRTARVVYTIPTFQNPSGISADVAARESLYELAERLDLILIEDDPYSEVYFDPTEPPPPPIASLDRSGRVVYLGSLSKVLCPGLRAAWTVASPEISRYLELAKEGADLCSSTLDHAIAAEAVKEGLVDDRLPSIRRFYAERCSTMLDALQREAMPGCSWTRPTGGLFVWVNLPDGIDARLMLDAAVDAGVAYVPGAPFFVDGTGANTLRLAFSKEEPAAIDCGITTLFGVLAS
ncbi:MAG: PLP-dependent aminotransferase family protein [Blastocatellia bacterium]|nr:PLP-dependent aminotransferase family protein [Blastocatellia bacterium]